MPEISAAQPFQPTMSMPPNMRPQAFDTTSRKDIIPLPTLPSLSSNMNKRKRSPSKSGVKPNKVAKKSPSQTPLSTEQDLSADGDKKRNKLGYHRTSVACGHCRRRKIRCMMPDDDPSGRCSNCIRLKKECIFCPVDQSATGKNGSRGGISSVKGGMRSASPAPMYLNGLHSEGFNNVYQGHTSFSVPPPETGLNIFGTSSSYYSEPTAAYSQSYDMPPATTWDSSPYAPLPPISGANSHYESPLAVSPVSQPYGRPSSTFRPSPFQDSTYGSASTTSSKHTPSNANEIGWTSQGPNPHVPHRAMSLTVEDPSSRGGMRQSHSPQPGPLDSGRRSTSIQPPSLVMGDTSSTASLSEPTTMGSMSAPIGSQYFQNPWTPIPGGPADFDKPFDGSWFPDPINGY